MGTWDIEILVFVKARRLFKKGTTFVDVEV